MQDIHTCPHRYQLINNHCYHYIWPPTVSILMGTIILGFTNSLATLAGVGGGSIALVILMTFFQYLPKDASLVVFACVLGASAGNTFNLLFKAYNSKPLIQYKYVFVSIPIMFTGSFIGILMNKLFPSIITYSIIIIVFLVSVKKTYHRFISEYTRQSEEILLHGANIVDLHQQTIAQPFKDQRNIYIFKNIGVLMVITIVLSFIRGSSKFPSIIGLQPCSGGYWIAFVLSFFVTIFYAYRNIQILRTWYPADQLDQQNKIGGKGITQTINQGQVNKIKQTSTDVVDDHVRQMIQMSIGAGILSGFGLGGGVFLVPMYRHLGCKPLQATATCAFGICITSFINCLQAVSIGAIKFSQFVYFVLFLGSAGYVISKIISSQLRKRNRFSLVEGFLFALTILAIVNIPISLYQRYASNGYNPKVIFGFGHLC